MRFLHLVFTLVLFLFPFTTAQAKTETRIETSSTGSSHSSVSVSSETSERHETNIRIETNGEVQEYYSDKPEDVSIQSHDGRSTITINRTSPRPSSPPTRSPTITPTPDITHVPTLSIRKTYEEREKEHMKLRDMVSWIRSWFF